MKKLKFFAALAAAGLLIAFLCCFNYQKNYSDCFRGLKTPGNTLHERLTSAKSGRIRSYSLCSSKNKSEDYFFGDSLTLHGLAYNFDILNRTFYMEKNGEKFFFTLPLNARIVIDGKLASFENLRNLCRKKEITLSAPFCEGNLVVVQTVPYSFSAVIKNIENKGNYAFLELDSSGNAINKCIINSNTVVYDEPLIGSEIILILDGMEALEVRNK